MRPPNVADSSEYKQRWDGYLGYWRGKARGFNPNTEWRRGWELAAEEDQANAPPPPPCHAETVLPAHHATPTS